MAASDTSGLDLPRSRFFRSLFASYAVILILTGSLVGWQVNQRLAGSLTEDLRSTLADHCRILVPFARLVLGDSQDPSLRTEFERLRSETGLRVTLVRADGRVAGDTHEDISAMDDHSSRPEIVEARTHGMGFARRESHTVGYEMQYAALRVDQGGAPLGFVRVALPVSQIDGQLATARRSVLLGTAAGVVFALLLGLVFAGHVTRPITEMTRVARALSSGEYSQRVHVGRRDELGVLAETLNDLGAEVTRRIAALSQEDAQLRAMLSSMIEGVVAVDEAERVAFINQAARNLLEIDASQAEGHSLWDLAPIRDLEALVGRVRATGRHELIEVDLFRGGKERVFQAHASPFQGGGKGGFVLVLHDITELRRLERVRRDFVANVSHELKTPLTSIQGFVETLLSGALEDQANNVRFLQRIDANVKRLTNLVSDLLSLAKIESGQLDVERTVVDWRDVLDGVLRLREAALSAKGLTLEVPPRERGLRVRGDREAMTQVLDNLIDNAIQYTPAPGRVRVSFATQNGFGVVAVEDSGIGIPAADLDRIFERFYRVDKARSRAVGGTGLGLSIVKNLVLRMEGDVRVTSTEGRGSTFSVLLPLAV